MKQIKLGNQGLIIPKIGLGCMGMTGFAGGDMYGKADENEAIATIHRSFEMGEISWIPQIYTGINPMKMNSSLPKE